MHCHRGLITSQPRGLGGAVAPPPIARKKPKLDLRQRERDVQVPYSYGDPIDNRCQQGGRRRRTHDPVIKNRFRRGSGATSTYSTTFTNGSRKSLQRIFSYSGLVPFRGHLISESLFSPTLTKVLTSLSLLTQLTSSKLTGTSSTSKLKLTC